MAPLTPDAPYEPLVAVALYIGLAWMLAVVVPGFNGLNVVMILGILYWVLVQNRTPKPSYYLRYHMLQAMIMNLFLWMGVTLLVAGLELILKLLEFVQLNDIVLMLQGILNPYLGHLVLAVYFGFAFASAMAALLGKQWVLPFGISNQIRYWV